MKMAIGAKAKAREAETYSDEYLTEINIFCTVKDDFNGNRGNCHSRLLPVKYEHNCCCH